MHNTNIVALSPHRPNIYLSVKPKINLEKLSSDVVEELKRERMNFPKTVIFCRSYTDTTCFQRYGIRWGETLLSHQVIRISMNTV